MALAKQDSKEANKQRRSMLRYASVMVSRYSTATHCNTHTRNSDTPMWWFSGIILPHIATRCNTLQHAATQCNSDTPLLWFPGIILPRTATCCNTLQLWYASVLVSWYHTATHCNTHTQLRYASVMVFQYHTATYCHILQHAATHCNCDAPLLWFPGIIPQHIATHCDTLQETATSIRFCYGVHIKEAHERKEETC